MAVAFEVAKLKGRFGLRPPPEGQCKYHNEVMALRAAADGKGEKGGSRRTGAPCWRAGGQAWGVKRGSLWASEDGGRAHEMVPATSQATVSKQASKPCCPPAPSHLPSLASCAPHPARWHSLQGGGLGAGCVSGSCPEAGPC